MKKSGWYKINYYSVYVEGGKVIRAILEAINDHFTFEGPALLVNNEGVRYSKLPKVEKIAHVSYTFTGEEVGRC